MMNRSATLVTMVAAVALMATTMGPKAAPRFVWNVSESVPTGPYHVQPVRQLIVTTLVVAYPPEPLATFLADGGYLPRGVPLIKRVLTLPGQKVCCTGLTITVYGPHASAAAADARSRSGMAAVWSPTTRSSSRTRTNRHRSMAATSARSPCRPSSAVPRRFGHSRRTDRAATLHPQRCSGVRPAPATFILPGHFPTAARVGANHEIGLAPATGQPPAAIRQALGHLVQDDRMFRAVFTVVKNATLPPSLK